MTIPFGQFFFVPPPSHTTAHVARSLHCTAQVESLLQWTEQGCVPQVTVQLLPATQSAEHVSGRELQVKVATAPEAERVHCSAESQVALHVVPCTQVTVHGATEAQLSVGHVQPHVLQSVFEVRHCESGGGVHAGAEPSGVLPSRPPSVPSGAPPNKPSKS